MWALVILVQCFTATAAMLGNARMAYASARDGALPLSRVWTSVSSATGTPVNAVWLVVAACMCLVSIGFRSTETILSIFNVCAPALDLSYVAVIIAHRVYEHRVAFIPGPYTLGRWSRPVNFVAVTWSLFITVILFFPPVRPVTALNMDCAVVVAACVGGFSLAWWWVSARKTYTGPRTSDVPDTADEEEGGSSRGGTPP